MTPALRFNFTLASGLILAGLGAFVIAPLWHQEPFWLGLIGLLLGLWPGSIFFKEQHEKVERKHIHIPKEMRDGYNTGLVMKRIMEIYQPHGQSQEEEEGFEDDDSEEESDEDDYEPEETDGVSDEDVYSEFRWKD